MPDPEVTFSELDPASTPPPDAAKPGESAAVPPIQLASEAELAQLRDLADLGITPATAPTYIQAKANLDSIQSTLANDPDVLLAQLQAANPEAYFKLLDKSASRFLQHFPPPEEGGKADGNKGTVPASDPRIDQLKAEIEALKSSATSRAQAERAATVERDYTTRIDSIVEDVAGKAKMDEDHKELFKLRLNASIARDPKARQRIMSGVYADIPIHAQQVLKGKAADTKATIEGERNSRAAVAATGTREPASGAGDLGGSPAPDGSAMDQWDDAATGFAQALVAANR